MTEDVGPDHALRIAWKSVAQLLKISEQERGLRQAVLSESTSVK